FRMNDNVAAEGAALYLGWDNAFGLGDVGTIAEINNRTNCGTDALNNLIGVSCAPGVPCDEISGNIAQDSNNQPTTGAVILVGSPSILDASRLALRGNHAAYLVNMTGDASPNTALDNCLIADNHTQHELIGVRRDQPMALTIDGCTIAHNTIDNGYVLYGNSNTTLTLTESIIDMPGVSTLDYTGSPANLTVSYVVSNDTSTLPAANGVDQGAPDYVDAAAGDYHLRPTS